MSFTSFQNSVFTASFLWRLLGCSTVLAAIDVLERLVDFLLYRILAMWPYLSHLFNRNVKNLSDRCEANRTIFGITSCCCDTGISTGLPHSPIIFSYSMSRKK